MDRYTAMETFISVIETGSFSGGGRRMNVGQPAVSKTIAQLESKLGVRLFVRTTRGLTPTEAGQRFYERAKNAIEAAEDADSKPVELAPVCRARSASTRASRLPGFTSYLRSPNFSPNTQNCTLMSC